jgi:hypothetical protein
MHIEHRADHSARRALRELAVMVVLFFSHLIALALYVFVVGVFETAMAIVQRFRVETTRARVLAACSVPASPHGDARAESDQVGSKSHFPRHLVIEVDESRGGIRDGSAAVGRT